jgi:hypothetical protein
LGVFPGWVYFPCILLRVLLLVYFPRAFCFVFAQWNEQQPTQQAQQRQHPVPFAVGPKGARKHRTGRGAWSCPENLASGIASLAGNNFLKK